MLEKRTQEASPSPALRTFIVGALLFFSVIIESVAAVRFFEKATPTQVVHIFNRTKDGFHQLPVYVCYTSISEEFVESVDEIADEDHSIEASNYFSIESHSSGSDCQYHSYEKRALYLMYRRLQINFGAV